MIDMMVIVRKKAKVDPRRRQEQKDSRMVQEDPRMIANLPSEPIHREFNPYRFVEHIGDYNDEIGEWDE